MLAKVQSAISAEQLGELDRVGALQLPAAIETSELEILRLWSDAHDSGRPGERVHDLTPLDCLLGAGAVGMLASSILGADARPVRALLFDKTANNNWALGWHQDRTIAVKERRAVGGFEVWSVKSGVSHVEPPFELIERMLTLRIHLDAVDERNAPLRVSPGSHRLGKIPETQIDSIVNRLGDFDCLAEASDIWAYRTAILHASKRAEGSGRRRVLQVDYSTDRLPDGLRWAVD